jgi:hypothetical protein
VGTLVNCFLPLIFTTAHQVDTSSHLRCPSLEGYSMMSDTLGCGHQRQGCDITSRIKKRVTSFLRMYATEEVCIHTKYVCILLQLRAHTRNPHTKHIPNTKKIKNQYLSGSHAMQLPALGCSKRERKALVRTLISSKR